MIHAIFRIIFLLALVVGTSVFFGVWQGALEAGLFMFCLISLIFLVISLIIQM